MPGMADEARAALGIELPELCEILDDPLMREIRYLDKQGGERAKGKAVGKVLRG